jgi:ATP-binding cassette, subfamily B, multidrug efflux pump
MRAEEKSGQVFDLQILRRIFGFIRPYRGRFVALVLLIMAQAAIVTVNPVLVRHTIDQHIATGNATMLSLMLALMVGVLVISGLLQFMTAYLAGWMGQTVIRDIRVALYHKILYLRLKFYDDTPIGRLVTRTVSDIETLNDVFSEGLASIAGDILQLILVILVMVWMDWRLALISLSTVPFMLISTYFFKEYIKKSFNEVRLAVAALSAFVQEHITGMAIVQIFSAEKQEYQKFVEINRKHRDANIRSIWAYSIYFPVADVISAIATGLIVWYGAKEMIREEVSMGTVTSFLMFISLFFRPIRMLADRFNTLQMGIVSTERILKLLDSEEYTANNGSYVATDLQGKVAFDKVWFAYNEEHFVLKDISFDVAPGQTVALVGATGAGKSSVINLLSRFYEINRGAIWIDDRPLIDYELGALRSKIAVVLQDVFLFSNTIEYNITMGNPAISQAQVIEAAKLVGAHEFIEKLPGAYQYNVMERGATLSVGQRQLISFVRAIVHDPKIIVLDEATSSVDTETEEMIQAAIGKLMKGRTAIVIAHRLSTIQHAHQIIVLDKGEIQERGTHEELLQKGGFYTNLYRMQYKELA